MTNQPFSKRTKKVVTSVSFRWHSSLVASHSLSPHPKQLNYEDPISFDFEGDGRPPFDVCVNRLLLSGASAL
jgi:hypothetical protein